MGYEYHLYTRIGSVGCYRSTSRRSRMSEGLSSHYTWKFATPILWYFVIFLNAFLTTIGIGARDLAGPQCFLNENRTVGQSKILDGVTFYATTCAIYPSFCILVLMFLALCSNNRDLSLFQSLVVNFFVGLSGTLYIAADNLYFLVDPEYILDSGINATTARSFIAASSILCTLVVIVINRLFDDPLENQLEKPLKSEKELRHDRFRHTDCWDKLGIDRACESECCKSIFTCVRWCQANKQAQTQAASDTSGAHKGKGRKQEVPWVKYLLLWSPWALVIATFDSLFISVVNEVSGDEDVRSGLNCTSISTSLAATGFYILTASLLCFGLFVFGTYQIYNLHVKWSIKKTGVGCIDDHYICLGTVYAVIIALVFMLNGTLFMAVDNNWPWICLAKDSDNICTWVRIRVVSLVFITICMCVIFFVILYLLLWEWYSEHKKLKDVPVEDSSDLVGNRDDIPLDSITQDA